MAALIALEHHEHWDGNGYPDGKQGERISLQGRITAIADVFDALVSIRPYKGAWPPEKAVGYIRRERGVHFDPDLVDLFLAGQETILAIQHDWADAETG
jgi:putative two-component system response regulator